MIHNDEAIDQAIQVLNEAVALDPASMNNLFTLRIRINNELGAHPTLRRRAAVLGLR